MSWVLISSWLTTWVHDVTQKWIRESSIPHVWESARVYTMYDVLSATWDKTLGEGARVGTAFQQRAYGSLGRGGGISAGPGRTGRIWRWGARRTFWKDLAQAQAKRVRLQRMGREQQVVALPGENTPWKMAVFEIFCHFHSIRTSPPRKFRKILRGSCESSVVCFWHS